ncbi:hypothetical protein I3F58_13085 [Streptomyces sp. MUM 203J]|uniref:hypothetical protein n=1 Tax=Streptomyces sp. MUM 203J TaxID=2791990 RepID=UPI001F03F089|nr:hypothetical protein [Streptomyces sp. MUM 203J]MCH0540488.1 hypothetical protein [Streptomyces sp. MUM 203J]
MRRISRIAAVTFAAAAMIGATASVAAADDGDLVVSGSNCTYAQGELVLLYENGCSVLTGPGTGAVVTVSDGAEQSMTPSTLGADGSGQALEAERDHETYQSDENGGSAAAAAAAAGDGAAAAAAAASGDGAAAAAAAASGDAAAAAAAAGGSEED